GSMRVEMKVHESSLDKVRVGQPVRVTVEALPGRVYHGRVSRISPLPDAQSFWQNPDLTVYSTTVVLEGTGEEIRTGMTCEAQIIVEQHEEAIYVPVQSVVRVGALPVVYVPTRGEPEAVPVEIGLDNNRMVHLLDGVEPGDRVLLAPPLTPSKETLARLTPLQPEPTANANARPTPVADATPAGEQPEPD
ncbi:MAG: efflux RND transporter periplasmic adaptor subunit, partial [Phycisphaeraceae bacterium]